MAIDGDDAALFVVSVGCDFIITTRECLTSPASCVSPSLNPVLCVFIHRCNNEQCYMNKVKFVSYASTAHIMASMRSRT